MPFSNPPGRDRPVAQQSTKAGIQGLQACKPRRAAAWR